MTNEQKPREFYIYERYNESWLSYEVNIVDGFTVQTKAIEYSAYEKLQKENQLLITALKTCELEIPKGFDGSGDNLFKAVRDLITNTLNYCEQNKGK